jgi:membrane associated rhomboid family serine protease
MFNQPIPAVTKNLLIINGLFFLATYIFGSRGIDLGAILAAFYPESPYFKPWQIITHMFMHGDLGHLAFNMFGLWMFGSTVENVLGRKKFLILYFAAGLGSFLLFNFVNYLQVENLKPIVEGLGFNLNDFVNTTVPIGHTYAEGSPKEAIELLSYFTTPMVGASGAIYGVLVAFGVLYPNAKLALLFFPVPVKAKYFIPVMIAIEFFLGLQNYSWNPIAHFAHLGGAIIGFILVYTWKKNLTRGW